MTIEFLIGGVVLGAICYMASYGNTFLISMSCIAPIVGLILSFLPKSYVMPTELRHTEKAYLIRAKKTTSESITKGREIAVNVDTCNKAVATGDYEYLGEATDEGGYYFTGGGYGEIYVPPGEIVISSNEYEDERLN